MTFWDGFIGLFSVLAVALQAPAFWGLMAAIAVMAVVPWAVFTAIEKRFFWR